MTPSSRYEEFLALHHQPRAFVMPNAWDGLSALILTQSGFPALGTSSAALAATVGRVAPRPVSVAVGTVAETLTVDELSSLGVKRISTGPALYRHVAAALQRAAKTLVGGDVAGATSGMTHAEMTAIISFGPERLHGR
ncbi:isocitrate lyase/phosphoenolpyruvate mutase family protein [Mycobacterium yunnanensis]|uniref:Isocitrate lyase/phosphoenolpyruvate mutase family protein n=1 Tax=Mycobacterium yunnanensis TaxID=368477 RepID=A0A9X2ZAI0_9MYCO|nr:isocitrate lyase/phosphoenolpyruvate mutase family protein [Mycobacterium yunnanensis]MCV7424466.1 isocitrate lyase/phosphoenolpyruvate mutase family protein [Mycobacterium yunnanensis]